MCKLSVTNRNNRRINLSKLYKEKRQELKKEIIKEQDAQKKLLLVQKLDNLIRDSSTSRIRNRCSLTGRPRGIIGKFGICRNKLNENLIYIPGIKKASW